MIPKVYSLKRSGTHLLMASIYYNFELPDVSAKISMARKSWNGEEVKGKEVEVPWAHLFGSHYVGGEYGVFIFRHPMNTFYSHWVFCGKPSSLDTWLQEKDILHWKKMVDRAYQLSLLKVKYEDLINDFQNTMEIIRDYFKLAPKNHFFVPVENGVGWDANKSDGHEHRLKYDQKSLELVQKVLGKEIYGYKISNEL